MLIYVKSSIIVSKNSNPSTKGTIIEEYYD